MAQSFVSDDESDEEEELPDTAPSRMTPMELDVQLQMAELVFRSLLEGKRVGVHPSENVDDWHREVLGEAWLQQNKCQRREVQRQMKASGENTPMWMEAMANMSDIAWEVFEAGDRGEMVRRFAEINRHEVLQQFKELYPKVRDSYYARCGAGDRLYGFRACIAIFQLFMRDPEMLDHCAKCLRLAIKDHAYNREGLAEVTVPLPPEARGPSFVDRGWSFLRHALDAFVVQAGGDAFGGHAPTADEDAKDKSAAVERQRPDPQVAVRIAECIVAARPAPALRAQLQLLKEPVPDGARIERRELHLMIPVVFQRTQQLLNEVGPHPGLSELMEMLRMAGGDEEALLALPAAAPADTEPGAAEPGAEQPAAVQPGGAAAAGAGPFSSLAAGVRHLLGNR